MQRRYKIAILLGCFVGLISIYISAVVSEFSTPLQNLLVQPSYPVRFAPDEHLLLLQFQARMLLSGQILLTQGLWYLAIPSGLFCLYAMFTQMALEDRSTFCISAAVSTAAVLVLAVIAVQAWAWKDLLRGDSRLFLDRLIVQYTLWGACRSPLYLFFLWLGEFVALFGLFSVFAAKEAPFDSRFGQLWTKAWRDPSDAPVTAPTAAKLTQWSTSKFDRVLGTVYVGVTLFAIIAFITLNCIDDFRLFDY